MMSLFSRPDRKATREEQPTENPVQKPVENQAQKPVEEPVNFKPFQRYRGRDEVRKQAVMRSSGNTQPGPGPITGPGGIRPGGGARPSPVPQPIDGPFPRPNPVPQPIDGPGGTNPSMGNTAPYVGPGGGISINGPGGIRPPMQPGTGMVSQLLGGVNQIQGMYPIQSQPPMARPVSPNYSLARMNPYTE